MATSGKNSKTSQKTAKADSKEPATSPVILSNPVEPGEATVSRIPPSIPIDSGLVGETDNPLPAAARKSDDSDTKMNSGNPAAPAQPAATSSAPAPAKPVESRRGGFWPMALGGVVAAGLGAAAAIWALPQIAPEDAAPPIDAEALKAEAVSAATEAGATAGAQAAQDAIAALPAPETTDLAAAEGDEGALQAELQAQAEKIAALEQALANLPAAPEGAGDPSTAAPAGNTQDLSSEIAALREQLSQQASRIEDLSSRPALDPQALEEVRSLAEDAGQVRAEIEAAAQSAQESLSSVQTEAEAAAQRARAVASVAVLGAALEHGGSPTEAVEQLQESGVEVPEALAQEDLPTLVQIQMGYDGVARTALRESLNAESRDGGAMTAVGNFLRVQTGARSVEPREGDDPDAVLSRAGALVEQGEISAALDELDALPPEGQAAMEGWLAQARAYLDAEAALNDVATTLN